MAIVTPNRQLNFAGQLQRLANQALDVLGVKPNPSLFIKNLNGEVLAYKHFLSPIREDEFINSFKESNSKIEFFEVKRVQMPNNLYSAKATEIEQELFSQGENTPQGLYEQNRIESYILNTQSETWSLFSRERTTIEEAQLAAVQLDVFALLSIENPSEKLQMVAVEKEQGSITLLDDPCEAVQIYAAERDPFVVSLIPATEKACLVAVQQDPKVIIYIENPTYAVCKKAIETEFPETVITSAGPEATKELFRKLKDIEEECSAEKLIAHNAGNYKQGVLGTDTADWRHDKERQKALEVFNRESLLTGNLSTEETGILNQMQRTGSLPYTEVDLLRKFNFSAEMKEFETLIENRKNGDDNDGELYENELYIRMKAGYILEESGCLPKGTTMQELVEEGWKPERLIEEGWKPNILRDTQVELPVTEKFEIQEIHVNGHDITVVDFCKETGIYSVYMDDDLELQEVTIEDLTEQHWSPIEKLKDQLDDLGVSDKEQEKCIADLIALGKTNSLVPIHTSILNQDISALVRLSINETDSGNPVLNLHFVRKNLSNDLEQPFMGHYFSEEQKRNLISSQNAGEVIQITNTKGKPQLVLVSVDKLTGELVAQPVEKVLIPDTFRGVRLTDEDKLILEAGQPLIIENVKVGKNTAYNTTVQYSADFKKIVALADSNKITIVGGAKLSLKESEELRKGKTIQVSNLIDDKGEKYSAFVRIGYPKEEILITPTNEHKVQVRHNNHGEKTENNKRLEKKRGQSPVKSGATQVKRTKREIN